MYLSILGKTSYDQHIWFSNDELLFQTWLDLSTVKEQRGWHNVCRYVISADCRDEAESSHFEKFVASHIEEFTKHECAIAWYDSAWRGSQAEPIFGIQKMWDNCYHGFDHMGDDNFECFA